MSDKARVAVSGLLCVVGVLLLGAMVVAPSGGAALGVVLTGSFALVGGACVLPGAVRSAYGRE